MGGPRILQMFQIQQNTDLPPESCKNKSPFTHTPTAGRRKMGPVCTAHSLAFSPARETKWKSMWRSALHCVACFLMCFMFAMCVCVVVVKYTYSIWIFGTCVYGKQIVCLRALTDSTVRPFVTLVCVNCAELCLFSPFSVPLLFSVSSPTVSLPTRPVSLDLSHEEATFWLQWWVPKNPDLNSADPSSVMKPPALLCSRASALNPIGDQKTCDAVY